MKETIQIITAILCALVVLLSPVACTMHRNEKISEALKNGVDPIEASCAMETMTTKSCANYIVRKNSQAAK